GKPRASLLAVARTHEELRAAHAQYGGGRLHLHGVGGGLGELARDHGQRALLQRALEGALMGGRVEREAIDGQHSVGAGGEQAVVEGGEAQGAGGAGGPPSPRLQGGPEGWGELRAAAPDLPRALRDLDVAGSLRARGLPGPRVDEHPRRERYQSSS